MKEPMIGKELTTFCRRCADFAHPEKIASEAPDGMIEARYWTFGQPDGGKIEAMAARCLDFDACEKRRAEGLAELGMRDDVPDPPDPFDGVSWLVGGGFAVDPTSLTAELMRQPKMREAFLKLDGGAAGIAPGGIDEEGRYGICGREGVGVSDSGRGRDDARSVGERDGGERAAGGAGAE